MAVIKIQRSQSRVQVSKAENLSPLVLSQNLALQVSNAYSQLGEAIAKTAAKTKATEDKNTLRSLKITALPLLTEKKNKYIKSTDINDAQFFLEDLNIKNFETLLKGYNQEVKDGFQSHLLKFAETEFGQLYTTILTNHAQKSEDTLLDTIIELDKQEADSNPQKRNNANKEKSLIWTDATNIANLGELKLKQLKEESDLRTKKFQLALQTDNDPISILAMGKELRTEMGDTAANYILQNADNVLISNGIQNDRIEEINFKADQNQKLENYAHVIKKIKLDDTSISLDDINDLYKANQINSAQRNSLYKIYAGEIELSDDNVIDLINGAMAMADTIEEIDLLKKTILLSPDIIDQLNVGDAEKFIGIFEKYDQDLPGYKLWKSNRELIEADLGKIKSANIVLPGGIVSKKDEKLIANTLGYYDELVLSGVEPDEAYIRTINEKLKNDKLPSIYELTDVISIDLKPPTAVELENGKVYFENRRTEILEVWKKTGDIKTFAEDISKIDNIEKLFIIRKDFYKDDENPNDKAFSDTNPKKKLKKAGT